MKTSKSNLREIMLLAWQMVKCNGFAMAEAMKIAWRNFKLKTAMYKKVVRFTYNKVDGSLREAYGTLNEIFLPATNGTGRRANNTLQTYFDYQKQEWRCFKKANLISVTID